MNYIILRLRIGMNKQKLNKTKYKINKKYIRSLLLLLFVIVLGPKVESLCEGNGSLPLPF